VIVADRRAVLESIILGDDRRITPGDRLRALDALSTLGEEQEVDSVRLELAGLDQETLDLAYDREFGPLISDLLDGGELAAHMPYTAARLKEEVERRVEARVREELPGAGSAAHTPAPGPPPCGTHCSGARAGAR
jgi:hypothetical protein